MKAVRSKIQFNNVRPIDSVINVTSTSTDDTWRKFSPFYPHGGIKLSEFLPAVSVNFVSQSLEGAWQGLKIFDNESIDPKKFTNDTMKKLKRGRSKKLGEIIGHYQGPDLPPLGYSEAREKIYLPIYKHLLETKLRAEVLALLAEARKCTAAGGRLILIDYFINCDVDNVSTPLSHAGVLIRHLEEVHAKDLATAADAAASAARELAAAAAGPSGSRQAASGPSTAAAVVAAATGSGGAPFPLRIRLRQPSGPASASGTATPVFPSAVALGKRRVGDLQPDELEILRQHEAREGAARK